MTSFRHVFWSESGSLVCLATEESYFILRVDTGAIAAVIESKQGLDDDGIESAFDVQGEVNEQVKTGLWVGDCFIYTNSVNRINYYVGGEIVTVSHLDRTMYLLGYVPKDNRLYLGDKELNVTSYSLLLSVLEYQTAVMRRDFETADRVLPTVPKEHRTRVAHFLEKQGFKKQALTVSTDPEHKFDLALQIGDLDVALALARESENPQKWSQLAEVATAKNKFDLVKECLQRANDFGGLLLLATSTGDADMLKGLGEKSGEQGKHNISFLSQFLLGDLDACLEILINTGRIPEAAFFARTYIPSKISYVVQLWRTELAKVNEKAGQSLADPDQYENLFPHLQDALKTEQYLAATKQVVPAKFTSKIPLNIERSAVNEMQTAEENGAFDYTPGKSVTTPSTVQLPSSSASQGLIDFERHDDVPSSQKSSQVFSEQPPQLKRKSSLDDFELEIEGINLDENIDTSVRYS